MKITDEMKKIQKQELEAQRIARKLELENYFNENKMQNISKDMENFYKEAPSMIDKLRSNNEKIRAKIDARNNAMTLDRFQEMMKQRNPWESINPMEDKLNEIRQQMSFKPEQRLDPAQLWETAPKRSQPLIYKDMPFGHQQSYAYAKKIMPEESVNPQIRKLMVNQNLFKPSNTWSKVLREPIFLNELKANALLSPTGGGGTGQKFIYDPTDMNP